MISLMLPCISFKVWAPQKRVDNAQSLSNSPWNLVMEGYPVRDGNSCQVVHESHCRYERSPADLVRLYGTDQRSLS